MVKKMSDVVRKRLETNMEVKTESVKKESIKEFETLLKEDFKKRFERGKYHQSCCK